MTIHCEQCAYWKPPEEEERLGECRRSPPVHEFWPVTLGTDWCGQATPREFGSTQPVHEAAQRVVDAWDLWVAGREGEAMPNGGWLLETSMDELQQALRRMKP
jgi:hypothetical protein